MGHPVTKLLEDIVITKESFSSNIRHRLTALIHSSVNLNIFFGYHNDSGS